MPEIAQPPPDGLVPVPPLFNLGPVAVTRGRLVKLVITVTLIGALAVYWHHLGLKELEARAQGLPALAVIGVISLMPLVGVPVSWLHLIAGVRFGFLGGMAVVAVTTLLQLYLGWLLVRVLPRRYFAHLEPWRARLKGAGHRDATILSCVLPGMPYTVQLYLLPVIGVSLVLLAAIATPLHTIRAFVTIILGDIGTDLTIGRAIMLGLYYLLLILGSAWLVRSLHRTWVRRPSGRKAPLEEIDTK